MFYFDDILKGYETAFQWDSALKYLEQLFHREPSVKLLCSLIGFGWYYFTQGPVVSGLYKEDNSKYPQQIWHYYINIGLNSYQDDPYVCFIMAHTLALDWFFLGKNYDKLSDELRLRAKTLCKDIALSDVLDFFIALSQAKTYPPKFLPRINPARLQGLFGGQSLLDRYFISLCKESF